MLIGVISDTHGYFNPQLRELFRPVELILHAGDIGAQAVIDALERIAPVVAVHGNVDSGLLAASYPSWRVETPAGRPLLLIHRGGKELAGEPELAAILQEARPEVVIYGHSHRAQAEWAGGVYYFNPGLGGRSRFGIRPSAGLLTVEPDRVEGEIYRLD